MSDMVSRLRVLADNSRKVYGLHAADCAAAMDEAASHIELLEAAYKSSGSALAVIDGGFKSAVDEIERLRLTDAERGAIGVAVVDMAKAITVNTPVPVANGIRRRAAELWKLLERTK